MFFINWLHTFEPSRIAFTLAGLPIYWYGLGYAVALFLAWALGRRLVGKERALAWEEVWWWGALAGLLGARLYFVFILEPIYFWHHPFEILAVWHGGMAIHGGVIGGVIGIWYTTKKLQSVWFWLDVAAPVLALGQAIGRWGNYFNQEVYGKLTTLPWGIPIGGQIGYFHPTFLYESALDLILAIILWRLFRRAKQLAWRPGRVVSIYLVGYGIIRFVMEFFRIDQTLSFGVLRLPQLVSLVMIVAGVYTYHYVSRFSTTTTGI